MSAKKHGFAYGDLYSTRDGHEFVDKDGVIVSASAPFNLYDGRDTSRFALVDFEESRTSQEFADDADINTIMARYLKTGTVPVYADRQPFYVEADAMPSFMEMQNVLIAARESFEALPAAVRERFGNDPSRFVEFATDEGNVAELRKMGLLSPEAVERLDAAEAAKAAKLAADRLEPAPKPAQADKPADRSAPTQ